MKILNGCIQAFQDFISFRIPLCPPELKSLYFEENTEIQAFLLHTESSFNWNLAVACEKKQAFFTRIHTKFTRHIGGINVIKEDGSLAGAGLFIINEYKTSMSISIKK